MDKFVLKTWISRRVSYFVKASTSVDAKSYKIEKDNFYTFYLKNAPHQCF